MSRTSIKTALAILMTVPRVKDVQARSWAYSGKVVDFLVLTDGDTDYTIREALEYIDTENKAREWAALAAKSVEQAMVETAEKKRLLFNASQPGHRVVRIRLLSTSPKEKLYRVTDVSPFRIRGRRVFVRGDRRPFYIDANEATDLTDQEWEDFRNMNHQGT